MFSEEEIERYYRQNYDKKNHKRARSFNVPERLMKDIQIICIEMNISLSKLVRNFITSKIMEYRKVKLAR